jgi:DNA polymerase III subunit epsilon
MDLLEAPLRTAEFLAVDVETNGCAGEECELTEVGAVLVGGGELHERWCSLVAVRAPLSPGIQRFTGISQAMVDLAPPPERVLPELATRLRGRVLVAHSAGFDRGVLADAFARAGLRWPEPPVLCTANLARRFAPLVRRRALGPLAGALGIDQEGAHRALPDAETCGRVFCALFPKLCANAATVGEAVALLSPRRRRRMRRRPPGGRPSPGRPIPPSRLDFARLPDGPGVYTFRDADGRPLYVGKSTAVRRRARSHFGAATEHPAWTEHATLVDAQATESELGALVLENRLIKRLRPPGNVALKATDGYVYLRCRLDIPFPVLEVASEPAEGLAINVGPLRGRHSTRELADHLTSLFTLRHCGRRLQRRDHPSAYGQMGRCLSPCLGDLDPNLYRQRLDAALGLFAGDADGRDALLAEIEDRMRAAAAEQRYERAATLRRRHDRVAALLDRLGGDLRAAHSRAQLVLAPGPAGHDAFWLAGGRVADWGPLPSDRDELERRTALALARRPPRGAPDCAPPDAVQEMRIVATWLDAHPDVPVLDLPPAAPDGLRRFVVAARRPEPPEPAAPAAARSAG